MVCKIFVPSLIISLVILPLLPGKEINQLPHNKRHRYWGHNRAERQLAGLPAAWLQFHHTIFMELVLILLIALVAILYRFYSDPERSPPETEKVVLSPADGKIIYVSPVEKDQPLVSTKGHKSFRLDEITSTSLLPDTAYLIGIEMNLLNVHVNRSPIEGKIVLQKHIRAGSCPWESRSPKSPMRESPPSLTTAISESAWYRSPPDWSGRSFRI
jgi:hypothetical protein